MTFSSLWTGWSIPLHAGGDMAFQSRVKLGEPIVFGDAAQSPDVKLTLKNLAAGANRVSDQHDLGDDPRAHEYRVRVTVQFATAPVVGETVDVYLATSDGEDIDGGVGAIDAAVTDDELANLIFLGSLVVTSTSASHSMTASFVATILDRYISIVVANETADNLANSDTVSRVVVTPVYRLH